MCGQREDFPAFFCLITHVTCLTADLIRKPCKIIYTTWYCMKYWVQLTVYVQHFLPIKFLESTNSQKNVGLIGYASCILTTTFILRSVKDLAEELENDPRMSNMKISSLCALSLIAAYVNFPQPPIKKKPPLEKKVYCDYWLVTTST